MASHCFVTQEATEQILLRVTNVCAECYCDLNLGDTIHYDMQNYRFLCDCCQKKLCSQLNDECEIIYDEADPGLFC